MKKLLKVLAIAVASLTLFVGCGINYNATLVTITNDGEMDTITLGYGNFVARYTQALYDSYYGAILSDGFWDTDMYGNGNSMEEDTKDSVMDEIKTAYLCKVHAADYGVELTEEQTKAIDAAAKKFMEDNDEEALSELGAKEEYVRDYLTYRTYYTLVSEKEPDLETKKSEWEAATTWTVDEKQWEKVSFDNKFVTKTEEATEE